MDLFLFFVFSLGTVWFLLSALIILAGIYVAGSYAVMKIQSRAGAKRLMKRHADS